MQRHWCQPTYEPKTEHTHVTIRHVQSTVQYVAGQLRDTLWAMAQKARAKDPDSMHDETSPNADLDAQPSADFAEESKQIETVRKERVFESAVTESELDIIQKRVALQQRQFAEFERREFARKARKIRTMFDYLSDEEIKFALDTFRQDEEEVIVQFSCPGYLYSVRKELARVSVQTPQNQPTMTDEQRAAYEQLLRKRTSTLRKSTTDDAKKKYRNYKRLALDDALKQLQQNKLDLSKAMEGWSAARIKAYQAIDTKPNTYYYRFNAPGEEQRTGGWTEEEKRLFHKRLAELGANGQWGIFSMVIPGRVGYQCSNYYRYLIETQQIHDPNYVLDERGKAHYLFNTKQVNSDGTVIKTFRTHKKRHTYAVDAPGTADDSPGGNDVGDNAAAETKPRAKRTTRARVTVGLPATTPKSKRKRRKYGRYDSSDDDNDGLGYQDDSSDEDYAGPTRAGWNTTKRTRVRPHPTDTLVYRGSSVTSGSSDVERAAGNGDTTNGFDLSTLVANGLPDSDLQAVMDEDEDMFHDPENPLPGFTDPITLEPVVKPAISPYGHVMGYESWVRCVTSEATRNICPLTKKPLSKRDLVVLTHDNIAEYKDKIVNL
ncbi:hypothetical protein H4R35_003843 [Dimargaris xerosporica]|nr:hypothetical protein H4R35_003843 [Dimargaris xerosporica]